MNYFTYRTAAERYANGRPFFHPLAVRHIWNICCESGRINRALDVGCGTGQSTLALLEVAEEIVGLDNSAEMLALAVGDERIRYVEARAEQLPFDVMNFGLVTVAGAFHWFDQPKFMEEARRVLLPGGWLVIYNDGITGRMNPSYEAWNRENYLVRYPTPPRKNHFLTDSDAVQFGFTPVGLAQFVHEVEFTPDQLVSYLLTQTNVISSVEAGRESLQSVANWLLNSVEPMFSRPAESFPFACEIRFLKRT